MKYVILRCEDAARASERMAALLESGKLPHLQQLAQAGAAGLIRRRQQGQSVDRLHLHRALCGVDSQDANAAPARWYAASMNLQLAAGETAWCADLLTQQEGKVVDPSSGGISTKEGAVLIQMLNETLGSETRRWVTGSGGHHLLVSREALPQRESRLASPSPELLVGQAWRRHVPKGASGQRLIGLLEEAATLLERHDVNRVRVDLGENPANMVWLWGATNEGMGRTAAQRTKRFGIVCSRWFPLRGFASCLGWDWREGPTSLEESALKRSMTAAPGLIEQHELMYLHLRVETADPVERLCAMERIDRFILKPLTEWLPSQGPWRLVAVIDGRTSGVVPLIAIGSELPRHPVARLDAKSLAGSGLVFEDGEGIFSWFTKQ